MENQASPLSLSFVVPALNEEGNIEAALVELRKAIEVVGKPDDFEIILVDDGSQDRTFEIMDRLAAEDSRCRVVRNERNLGFGGAFRRGVEVARMHWVMMVPGENTVTVDGLAAILSKLGEAEIVVPYPLNPDVRPFGRRVLSWMFIRFVNLLFGNDLRYYTGPAIYGRKLFNELNVATSSHAYQPEVLIKLLARGHSFVQVGMTIRHRKFGKSKILKPRNVYRVVRAIARVYWEVRHQRRPGGAATVARSDLGSSASQESAAERGGVGGHTPPS